MNTGIGHSATTRSTPPMQTIRVDQSALRTCVNCTAVIADDDEEASSLAVRCNDCGMQLYCSESCREQDIGAHKKDGFCQALKNLWDRRNQAQSDFESNEFGAARATWFRERFGEAFDGRNFTQLMKDRWSEDPHYRQFLDVRYEIALKYARHPTLAKAVEASIVLVLFLKQKTYRADPYNLDALMATVLLKLYREDAAVCVILHWLEWRSRGPHFGNLRDKEIERWAVGKWPYPVSKEARFNKDLVDRFTVFPAQRVGVVVPIEFALTLLVIKMRFITVYLSRAKAETLFLHWSSGGMGRDIITSEHKAHVLSFIVEGGRGRYFSQRNHANRLMDYIDGRDATLLRSLVDPAAKAQRSDDQLCFKKFLNDYANGEPVIRTIKRTLERRYNRGGITSRTT